MFVLPSMGLCAEDCPDWYTCPPGYTLNVEECICETATYPVIAPLAPSESMGEGGIGFEAAEDYNAPEGFLNIIYSFLSTMFVWILLFIIFLIILGVLVKFTSIIPR